MIEKIDVISCDIDMTLSAKGGMLPEVTMEAFEILHQQGVKIGLATGRVIEENLKHHGEFWGLSFEFDFVIGMNGGMVYNRADDSLYSVDLLTQDELRYLVSNLMPLLKEHEDIALTAEGGGNHYAINMRPELIEVAKRHGFPFDDAHGDPETFCSKRAFKLLLRGEDDQDALIRNYVQKNIIDKGDYAMVGSFPGTIEILKKGIDKGSGLQRYCDSVNIPMENVIAFGDNENDNTMLIDAGWGVCLLDGADGTKAVADDITKYDCENAGVGHYLFDHFINKQ